MTLSAPQGRAFGRHALVLALAGLVLSPASLAAADPPAKAFPPLPASIQVPGLPDWLRANTDIPPALLVSLIKGLATVMVARSAPDSAGVRTVVVRREALSDFATGVVGGRSELVRLEIDCTAAQFRLISRDIHEGSGLTGSDHIVAPNASMASVPPNTDLAFLVHAVCDPNYQPPLTPYLTVAAAAPVAPTPQPPAAPPPAQPVSARPQPATTQAPAPVAQSQTASAQPRAPNPPQPTPAAQAVAGQPPAPSARPQAVAAQAQPTAPPPTLPIAQPQTAVAQPRTPAPPQPTPTAQAVASQPPTPTARPQAVVAQAQAPAPPAQQVSAASHAPPPAPVTQQQAVAAQGQSAHVRTPPARPPRMNGKFVAQVAASNSEALARKFLADLTRRAPEVAGMPTTVERVRVNDAFVYRVSVVGFPTSAAAEAFCGRLRAARFPCWAR